MENWENLFIDSAPQSVEELRRRAAESFDRCGVYPASLRKEGDTLFFLARGEGGKTLVLWGGREHFHRFAGEETRADAKVCPLSHGNCLALRAVFPFLNPTVNRGHGFSLGLGDRLGLAVPGQLRALAGKDVFPVLAQQSIRELNLTGRNFESVLDDACWGVFEAGYTGGFGADADHLKTDEEVRYGLMSGYTMITLDCSEHIDNTVFGLDDAALRRRYEDLPRERRRAWEGDYLGRSFPLEGNSAVSFDGAELMGLALVYGRALDFMAHVYHDLILPAGRPMDFEVSIDETTVPTTPAAHYFIAAELKKRGVPAASLAPRFCGEFQKGIDYIGDTDAFEREFVVHEAIARRFGYRLSIHSGSDKFRVFPAIGRLTGGKVHVKTAGTNWLEAVRLIARVNPGLYRRMHAYALAHIDEARKYYHVGTCPQTIPALGSLDDNDIPGLMDRDDARQALHITYGVLLQAQDEKGKPLFRDEIYATLYDREEGYHKGLARHIGRHLAALGV